MDKKVPTNVRREVVQYGEKNILIFHQSFNGGESYITKILGYVPLVNLPINRLTEQYITPIEDEKKEELIDFLNDRRPLVIEKVEF